MVYIILIVLVILLIGGFYQQKELEAVRAGANPEGLWVLDMEKTMTKLNSMTLPAGFTPDQIMQSRSNMKLIITSDGLIHPFRGDKSGGPSVKLIVSKKTDSVTELGISSIPLALVVSNNLMDGRVNELQYLVFKRGSDSERQSLMP